MEFINVSDKQGNLLFVIRTFDKKVHKALLKQMKKIKTLNVWEDWKEWLRMFDIVVILMQQLVSLLPGLIALYILFDLIGALLFERR